MSSGRSHTMSPGRSHTMSPGRSHTISPPASRALDRTFDDARRQISGERQVPASSD
jgi:hypothetical protein